MNVAQPSVEASLLLVALVALVAFVSWALLTAVRASGERAGLTRGRAGGSVALVGLLLLAVLAVSWHLARSGWLQDVQSRPPRLMMLLLPVTIANVALVLSPIGGRIARFVPLSALIGFQVFRAPLELALWKLHREGVLPQQMTFEGRNFDVITGVSALLMWWLLRNRTTGRWLPWAWNLMGFALLANIVAVAIMSMPYFDGFPGTPRNAVVMTAPWVWLPAVLVQAALMGHLLTFRALLASRPLDKRAESP